MPYQRPVVVEFPSLNHADQKSQQVIGRVSAIAADVEEFRGIPYATVPGRWQHSQIRDRLPTDVFDTARNGPRCTQPDGPNNSDGFQAHLDFPADVKNSEFECLNLFVVRPSKTALVKAGLENLQDRLPVYVYIHGGAYFFGAGTDPMWNPARLVSRSIALGKPFIAVNVNYRLNIFGFAASSDIIKTQDGPAKGCNFGLGDQRTAIEWVSRNIAAFGGHPGKITVGGQSAGASSVHAHILDARSSKDHRLLYRAIVQSGAGGTLGPCSLAESDERWEHLCKHFRISKGSPEERFTKLAAVPAEKLLDAVCRAGWYVFPVTNDNLTVYGGNDGLWSVSLKLNNVAVTPVESTSTQPIHVLIGDTDVEGSVYSDHLLSKITSFEQVDATVRSCPASETAKIEIMHAYGLDQGASIDVVRTQLFSLLTDDRFGGPVDLAYRDLSASSPSNQSSNTVWPTRAIPYRVQYGNPFPGPCFGVAQHCVDIIYIYDAFHNDLRSVDRIEQSATPTGCDSNSALVGQMQSDWINFISAEGDQDGSMLDEGSLIVYGRDRRKRIVQLNQDEGYLARRRRFEVLRRHGRDTETIVKAIKAIGYC